MNSRPHRGQACRWALGDLGDSDSDLNTPVRQRSSETNFESLSLFDLQAVSESG
jgi:hypothetical protein